MLVCILLVLLPFCNFHLYLSIAFMSIKKICHLRYWVEKSVKQRKWCSNLTANEKGKSFRVITVLTIRSLPGKAIRGLFSPQCLRARCR